CLAGAKQRIAAASDLLASHGSQSLSLVDALLEEAIALLNHAHGLLRQGPGTERAQVSQEALNIRKETEVLSAVVQNGLSLYSLRLAKLLTDRGGYAA